MWRALALPVSCVAAAAPAQDAGIVLRHADREPASRRHIDGSICRHVPAEGAMIHKALRAPDLYNMREY